MSLQRGAHVVVCRFFVAQLIIRPRAPIKTFFQAARRFWRFESDGGEIDHFLITLLVVIGFIHFSLIPQHALGQNIVAARLIKRGGGIFATLKQLQRSPNVMPSKSEIKWFG